MTDTPKGGIIGAETERKKPGIWARSSRFALAILLCKSHVDAQVEDFDEEFRSNVTQVHVTTLDEVVSVNSFFCVAVFIGLSVNPNPGTSPLLPSNPACEVGLGTYRYLLLFEVLAFACFLFSSLIAHGIKLYIVLGNGNDKNNVKSAAVNNRFLRTGILFAAIGSAIGSVFLTLSLLNLIQIKMGKLTCGSVFTERAAIPLLVLVSFGVLTFISAVFIAFRE